MPTVPMLDGPRVQPNALPNVSAPIESFGGGQAIHTPDLSGMQGVALAIHREETQKADEIAVTKAAGQYSDLENRLRDRIQNTLGEDAFTLPEEIQKQFTEESGKILGSAKTDAQRLRFEQLQQQHGGELMVATHNHVNSERKRYDQAVTTATVSNEFQAAAKAWQDPVRVDMAIGNQVAALTAFGHRNGTPKEEIDRQAAAITSDTRTAVIDQMLANKMAPEARAYFEEHNKEIQDPQGKLAERIKVVSTDVQGATAAQEIWKSKGPENDNAPVRIADMEQAARDYAGFKGNPEAIQAAITNLRMMAQAHNAQQTEVRASNIATVYDAVNQGQNLSSIQRLPAYLALTGTERNQLTETILNQRHTAGERVYAAGQRAEAVRGQQGVDQYIVSSQVDWLRTHSLNEVRALQGSIGREFTLRLADRWEQIHQSDAQYHEVKIDEDLFKSAAVNIAKLPVFAKPADITTEDKQQMGELERATNDALAAAAKANPKATISREDRKKIVDGVADRWVMERHFWSDKRVNLFGNPDVPDEKAADYYRPIADIKAARPQFVSDAVAFLRQSGALRDPKMTDAQVEDAFRKQIEQAYARQYTAPKTWSQLQSQAELRRILTGKP